MARQEQQASPAKLAAHLGSSASVMRALTGTPEPSGYENPVWLGLKALARGAETPAEKKYGAALRQYMWAENGQPNKSLIMQAYVLAQTACLNHHRGAIGTGELGTIRQRWYFSKDTDCQGFKFAAQAMEAYLVRSAEVVLVGSHEDASRATKMGATRTVLKTDWSPEYEQELADELGLETPLRSHYWPKSGWGRAYANLQSKLLARLVRDGLTYDEMWVRDASRDVERHEPLADGFYGALLLEKQGLFDHFSDFTTAAGVPVLVAMSGTNAFSSVEAVLNDNFRFWEGGYKPTPENPLHLFVISDHDYSGHVPIQDGAAAQFERYLPGAVRVHRVGVTPQQVLDTGRSIEDAGYEFNYDRHSATREWAQEHGIWRGDICYGLEVEALEPKHYIADLVDAIIEALGGDEEMKRKLLEMAEPDWERVKERAAELAEETSKLLKTLRALGRWANDEYYNRRMPIRDEVEESITEDWQRSEVVRSTIGYALADQKDKIDLDDFQEHVLKQGWGAWRPVSAGPAEGALARLVFSAFEDSIKAQTGDIDAEALYYTARHVADLLEPYGLEV